MLIMEKMTIEVLINGLKDMLDCKQKLLAFFTGLQESTISSNLNNRVLDVDNKKAGRRIIALYLVVSHLKRKGAAPENIKTALQKYVYSDLDGNKDSVVTALVQDKYPANVLINIGDLGFKKHLESLNNDVIYNELISIVAS